MKKRIFEGIATLVLLLSGTLLMELTIVGALFLTNPRTPTNTATCDEIHIIHGQLYCFAKMSGPNENITVTRNE